VPSPKEPLSAAVRQSRRFAKECRNLGLRVRKLRQERELTLEAAATAMRMDITHLQKVEAGKVNLTMITLIRLADGLSVRISDLF
jgi:transcriptional regulator with XRE-family HTH domain